MAEYNPELPSLTLSGTVNGDAVGKTKYGVSDQTGLGPNGADKYIEYTVTISSISTQTLGDASVRDSLGLNVGGQYTGIDIKIGDYIAASDGSKIFKITEISSKSDNSISCTYQDTGMAISRVRSDRNNSLPDGTAVVIFEVGDNDDPLLAINQLTNFSTTTAIDGIQSYLDIYKTIPTIYFLPRKYRKLSIRRFSHNN